MNHADSKVWINALRPQGKGTELPLSIIKYLILPDHATAIEKNIAGILNDYWQKITGQRLIVACESENIDLPCIWLGMTRRAATLPMPERDGINIFCNGVDLVLRGGEGRGLANAVFSLLNDDLGCRFHAPEKEIVPQLNKATIVSRNYSPQLKLRDPYYYVSFDGDWSLRNRTNAPDAPVSQDWGGHACYPGKDGHAWHGNTLFVHTYHLLLSPKQYFDEHPEYFQMTENGERQANQLCETNPEVRLIVAANAIKALRENPHVTLIDVSRVDGGGSCMCPECLNLNKRENSEAASMLSLVNYVAEQIEKEFPRVTVSTLAYLETVNLPLTIRPRSNVAIRLCNDKCSWPHPFTPVRIHSEMAEIAGNWSKTGARLHVWDYNVNFSHYAAPMPNLDVIADNIRFWVECGAEALMTQGAYQSPGGERDLLRSWVIAQLMWNPELDVCELIQDFIFSYFGQAADCIAEYNALLEEYGERYRAAIDTGIGIRYPMNSNMLCHGFTEKAEAIYVRALQAAGNDSEIRDRVERDMLPVLYVKLAQYCGEITPEYLAEIDHFERVARRVGFLHVGETPKPGLDWQLQVWRELNGSSMIQVSPSGGVFPDQVEVFVSTHMGAVRLFYSLDGKDPNLRSQEIRSGQGIIVLDSCVLKIAMFMTGSCVGSVIGEYVYVIGKECPKVSAPQVLELV